MECGVEPLQIPVFPGNSDAPSVATNSSKRSSVVRCSLESSNRNSLCTQSNRSLHLPQAPAARFSDGPLRSTAPSVFLSLGQERVEGVVASLFRSQAHLIWEYRCAPSTEKDHLQFSNPRGHQFSLAFGVPSDRRRLQPSSLSSYERVEGVVASLFRSRAHWIWESRGAPSIGKDSNSVSNSSVVIGPGNSCNRRAKLSLASRPLSAPNIPAGLSRLPAKPSRQLLASAARRVQCLLNPPSRDHFLDTDLCRRFRRHHRTRDQAFHRSFDRLAS